MTSPTAPSSSRIQFCSAVSAASGEDTAGSAWHTSRYLMVEFPLPWSYNVLQSPNAPTGIEALLNELWDAGIHFGTIGFAPDEDWSVPGMTRIFDHRVPGPTFRGYGLDEYLVPSARVVSLIRALAFHPETLPLEPYRVTGNPRRNLFVCTHGAIDACCATYGYPIFKLLRSMATNAEHPYRVWRCTHFGGHRFAATLLEMPEGRYWGHLDARDLAPLITRNGSFADLRHRYRGWAAIENTVQQVAEAEVLRAVGWQWTVCLVNLGSFPPNPPYDAPEPEPGPWAFTFTYRHPESGETGTIHIDVETNGSIRTLHSSNADELADAVQYRAAISRVESAGGPVAGALAAGIAAH